MNALKPASLPREARDTLLILAAVALVLVPQLPHLPWWVGAAGVGMLLWRTRLAWQHRPLPGRWWRMAWLVLVVGGIWLQFRTIAGPEAGVALLALLLILKTLEMRARRDAMVIFFLGFFSLVTVFLQSQSLLTAIAALLALWALLAALVNAHRPAGRPTVRQLLAQSGQLLLWAMPLMLVLFVFFPRLPPLWGLPAQQQQQGKTGLSDSMEGGQVASLAQDGSVAMRVRFEDERPPARNLLYFRGPVLSEFDGRNWSAGSPHWPPNGPVQLDESAQDGHPEKVAYEVTLEPHRQRWLLTLDATATAPITAQRRLLSSPQLQWFSPQPITEVLRYQAQAQLHYRYGESLPTSTLKSLRSLPQGVDPRTRAWAQELRTTHGADDAAIVQAVLQRLRTGGYTYTLGPGVYPRDTADAFWFDSKQGFCEHIASAFAVLMRAADIPARVVTGYQGGERNPVDGLWTVRQSDAHAWTEVWLPEQGWVRIDPPASVAPARTDFLQRLQPPPSLLGGTMGRMVGNSTLLRLQANWEALNHRWNSWVLNDNSDAQGELFGSLGLERLKLSHWGAGLGGALLMGLLGTALWRLHQRRQHDPWLRLLQQARQRMVALGIIDVQHDAHAGPRQLAQRLRALPGSDSQAAQAWLLAMEQWRYAPASPQRPSLHALRRSFRALRWPRPD